MITREEVIKGYMINEKHVIAEMLYDTISKYEERIKSLESQLSSNPLQLTCDKCLFWKDYRKCPMADHEDVAPKNYCYNFYPKDTK